MARGGAFLTRLSSTPRAISRVNDKKNDGCNFFFHLDNNIRSDRSCERMRVSSSLGASKAGTALERVELHLDK